MKVFTVGLLCMIGMSAAATAQVESVEWYPDDLKQKRSHYVAGNPIPVISFGSSAFDNPSLAEYYTSGSAEVFIAEDGDDTDSWGLGQEFPLSGTAWNTLNTKNNLGWNLDGIEIQAYADSVGMAEKVIYKGCLIYDSSSPKVSTTLEEDDVDGYAYLGDSGELWGTGLTLDDVVNGELLWFYVWFENQKERDEFDLEVDDIVITFYISAP